MTMDFLSSGEFFSTFWALLWAVAVILFRKSGEQVAPVPLNVFKNTIATVLFPITMVLLGIPIFPAGVSLSTWVVLLVSGALGIGVADTLLFASLNRLGAGRSAIVESGYSPLVILCSIMYLHEPVRPTLLLAVALMLSAIFLGAWHPDRTEERKVRKEVRAGVLYGVLAMILMAIGVVLAKPVLEHTDPWWATAVRLWGGMAILAVHGAMPRHRREVLECFRPSKLWKVTVPAAVVGSYLAMFFWILGMKHTLTTTASVLNQTSSIFCLILATVFLREPLTRRRLAAMAVGFTGAIVAVT